MFVHVPVFWFLSRKTTPSFHFPRGANVPVDLFAVLVAASNKPHKEAPSVPYGECNTWRSGTLNKTPLKFSEFGALAKRTAQAVPGA